MTVSSSVARVAYHPSVSTTVFPISPIDYDDDSSILVYVAGELKTVGVDYTIDEDNVTLNTGTTDTVLLVRSTPQTQTKDVIDGDPFPVEVIEEGLDRIVRQVQEVQASVNNAVTLPNGYALDSLEMPSPEANKILGWNSDATELENKTVDIATTNANVNALTLALAALQSQVNGLVSSVADLDSRLSIVEAAMISQAGSIANLVIKDASLDADILALQGVDAAYLSRIQALEHAGFSYEEYDIDNNQAIAKETGFSIDSATVTSVLMSYAIERTTDTNKEISSGTLHLIWDASTLTWVVERGLTVVEYDGVVFTMSSLAGLGKLLYTSTALAGTAYAGKLKINYVKFYK